MRYETCKDIWLFLREREADCLMLRMYRLLLMENQVSHIEACSRDVTRPHTYRGDNHWNAPRFVDTWAIPKKSGKPVGQQYSPHHHPAHLLPRWGGHIVGNTLPMGPSPKQDWELEAELHLVLGPCLERWSPTGASLDVQEYSISMSPTWSGTTSYYPL